MTTQIAVRIPEETASRLDGLVADGYFTTRTEAVRVALDELIERQARRRIDEAIVEGYTRIPPTEEEERWAEAAGRQMIAEEPW